MIPRTHKNLAWALLCLFVLPGDAWSEKKKQAPPTYGTVISFHGWSPNSNFVAYTWVQTQRPKPPRKKPTIIRRRLNRRIWKGRLSTYGPASGRNVVAYAKRKKYEVKQLLRQNDGPNAWRFTSAQGTYRFKVVAGKKLRWELYLNETLVGKETCKALYVDILPTLYPSPNGRSVLIHLRQNTGWRWDDAISVVSTQPTSKVRARR